MRMILILRFSRVAIGGEGRERSDDDRYPLVLTIALFWWVWWGYDRWLEWLVKGCDVPPFMGLGGSVGAVG